MDVLDFGRVLRVRNDDGNPAHLRCCTPVSVSGGLSVSGGGGGGVEFSRKRRESGSVVVGGRGESSPGDGVKRVWRIAKRVKRESTLGGQDPASFVDNSCVHGRIVEAVLRTRVGLSGDGGAATDRIEARVESWWASSKGRAEEWEQQLKSSSVRPWRFMFFEKGEWVEFGEEANSVAWERFRSGSVTAEITVQSRVYLLNFAEMTQVNLSSGYVRSIAWIGDAWEVSLPANPFASPSERNVLGKRIFRQRTTWRDGATDTISNLMLGGPGGAHALGEDLLGRTGGGSTLQENVCISIDSSGDFELTKLRLGSYGGVKCSSETKKPAVVAVSEEKAGNFLGVSSSTLVHKSSGSPDGVASTLAQRFLKLEDGSAEFDDVKKKFLSGFGKLGDADSMITGIHRDASATAAIRQEAFARQEALTEQTRGNANVRWGWHGTSKKGVTGIFLHGFGQPKTPKNGSAYGVGVYLAVENQAFVSALYADNDENGEQHVVLCQVITGVSEVVKPPSEQFHPSSEHFDTGVDDLLAPKRLIVWSTHMNTHILPLYVVSFKLPPRWHRMMTELNSKHKGFSTFCNEIAIKHPCFSKQACDMAEHLRNKPSGCGNHHHGPTSAFIRFPHLFGFLQRLLSPEQRLELKNCYTQFEAGCVDRRTFVQEIQKMFGRDCLMHAINTCQGFRGSEGTSVLKSQ